MRDNEKISLGMQSIFHTWFVLSDFDARFVRWVAVRLITIAENMTLSTD